jgi:class 3 adenylate cyclase
MAHRFPDQNPNPVLHVAPDGSLAYANPAAARLSADIGMAVGAPINDTLLERLRGSAADGGPAVEVPAGRRIFALLPVADEDRPGGLIVYGTDVTARQLIERFPDENPNPVLRLGRDGTLQYANAGSERIVRGLGLTVGDALPEDLLGRIRAALGDGGSVDVDVESCTYALRPVLVEAFDFINLYGTDVTASRAMTKFPDRNPNPVLRCWSDGTLAYANPAAAPICRSVGMGIGDPVPAELWARINEVRGTQDPDPIEVVAEERTYELTVVSVYEFGFVNLYGTDVTAARQVEQAHRENERLLLNILPASIAERLRSGEMVIADRFEELTVLFADVVDFTPLSARLAPAELIEVLNGVFSIFDQLADRYGLEKIKTIGDAYMVVGGIGHDAEDHPRRVAEMGLEMIDEVARFRTGGGAGIAIRVGMHVGPAVAGVIGIKKFIYDVWGDTVNTASRLESTGEPGRIQVLPATMARLGDAYAFESRGVVELKGKGAMETWLIAGRRAGAAQGALAD